MRTSSIKTIAINPYTAARIIKQAPIALIADSICTSLGSQPLERLRVMNVVSFCRYTKGSFLTFRYSGL